MLYIGRRQSPFMKDRRRPYGVDFEGKRGGDHVGAKGGLLVNLACKSRFMHSSGAFMMAWSQ